MRFIKFCNERIKRLTCFDIALMEISVVATVLFLFSIWSGFRRFAFRIHWGITLGVAVAIILYLKIKVLRK